MIRIALDAMGGDHAPQNPIEGALQALKESDIEVILVGQSDKIKSELERLGKSDHNRLSTVHADEVIGMSESPGVAFRKKKNSSIHVGIQLVKDGHADGFLSAGNTGAVMAVSTFILGRIPTIERPCIGVVLPSEQGPVVMLDMGSNVDCKPNHLVQFAIMGQHYASDVLEIKTPKVGLLNIGEEEEKGNQLTQDVFSLLKNHPEVNFGGNVEGKAILHGVMDVVVCDGFIGNSLLKFGEGVVEVFFDFFKKEWKSSLLSKIGIIFLAPALKRFKKQFNYDERGGAPLLGVNGVSFIAHGSSSAFAIKSSILNVVDAVSHDMVGKITAAVVPEEVPRK